MLNDNVEQWIATIKDADKENIRHFLTFTADFLSRQAEYLQGSGLYVVGSSYTKKTYFCKVPDFFERKKELENEGDRKLIERFGEERCRRYFGSWGSNRDVEIDEMLRANSRDMWKQLLQRYQYDDIDCVVAGLPREKSDPQQAIWTEFSRRVREEFPEAKHPKRLQDLPPPPEGMCYFPTPSSNGFTQWEVYSNCREYVVGDYRLEVPARSPADAQPPSADPTKIHFMLYKSDERFGSEDTGPNFYDHEPSKDVSLATWKAQQEKDKLPFLTVLEF